MGKTIEKLAQERGHNISLVIGSHNADSLSIESLLKSQVDVAIEFSTPETACSNIQLCMQAGIPVVCGTTAWLDQWEEAITAMKENNGAFLYASNFSVGVNIFFAINKTLAKYMNDQPDYIPSLHEVHHTGKVDAPSGTGITLAEGVLNNLDKYSAWTQEQPNDGEILLSSERVDPAPGTHHVKYENDIDHIEIIHTAKSRKGFALGAIIAAEYLTDKSGLHTMQDVLGLGA